MTASLMFNRTKKKAMNNKIILHSILTLSLFAISLFLLTNSAAMLVELGKGVLLLSVLSLLPLAHATAKDQLKDKPYESTQIRELTQGTDNQKVA